MSLVRSTEIKFYQKYYQAGPVVLDFGCGDGFFLQTLLRFGKQKWQNQTFIGLDLKNNPRTKQIPAQLYQSLDLYDGTKLPYTPNYFDRIIANCVFEHLPNLDQVLKQLNASLKPNGQLFTTVMTNNWHHYLRLPHFFWDKVQAHHNLLTAQTWQKTFAKAGFKIVTTRGYLNSQQSRIVEMAHFTSLPYLISYAFFKRWDLVGPIFTKLVNRAKLVRIFSKPVSVKQAAGLFFVLKKV